MFACIVLAVVLNIIIDTAFAKNIDDQEWYEFNDSTVTAMPDKDVKVCAILHEVLSQARLTDYFFLL